MSQNQTTFFVAIANYRDREVTSTINDLLRQATRPDLIRIGVLSQVMADDDNCCAPAHPQVEEILIDAATSQGVCWARSCLYQKLLGDETFILQIDSHMRFEPGWDKRLFTIWQQCQNPKAIISHYPLGYKPPNHLPNKEITVLKPGKFNASGTLVYQSDTYPYNDRPESPIPSAFFSGNFLFAPASALRDVPYDPKLYFFGEEITMSVRLWTHGWDFYAPNDVLAYHNYAKQTARPRHWDDHATVQQLEARSVDRIQYLLTGREPLNAESLENIERYGLGKQRTLSDYEALTKVDFQQQKILETHYVKAGRPVRLFKA